MRKKVICALATALIVSTTAAFAAVKEESFTVTPLVGGYVFDGGKYLDPTLVLGLRVGYNFTKHLGIEALYDYATSTDGKFGPLTDITLQRFGGQVLYNFFPDNIFVPYVAAGFSDILYRGAGIDHANHGAFDYGVGAKLFLTDDVAIRGDIRHIIYSYNSGTYNDMEFTLGAYVQFGTPAPAMKASEPAPEPVKVEAAPAPAPPAPTPEPPPTPAPVVVPIPPPPPAAPSALLTVAPAQITKGESATLSWTSQNASKCDIQPVVGSVQPQGSMSVTPAGNTTYMLACTGEGGTATKSADITVTVPPPVKATAVKLCSPTVIDIQFDTNKADIKPQYHDELKKLGDFLTQFSNAKGVIEGHTDNVGNKASNMKLSQHRADSVRNYIIKTFGIAPERISAKGYGPTKPLVSNKTKEGKAKNRRIEANFTCE